MNFCPEWTIWESNPSPNNLQYRIFLHALTETSYTIIGRISPFGLDFSLDGNHTGHLTTPTPPGYFSKQPNIDGLLLTDHRQVPDYQPSSTGGGFLFPSSTTNSGYCPISSITTRIGLGSHSVLCCCREYN